MKNEKRGVARPKRSVGRVSAANKKVRLRAHADSEVRVLTGQNAFRPVTDCNCFAVRQGGEQQEVNDQSVG
jgi:hypothetical protein